MDTTLSCVWCGILEALQEYSNKLEFVKIG
jgi:hypothetical protein